MYNRKRMPVDPGMRSITIIYGADFALIGY